MSELIRRGMSLAPRLDVRPGFGVTVMITQGGLFPAPYRGVARMILNRCRE